MTEEIQQWLDRKGARKATEIPAEVQRLLNEGKLESVNLIEWQAVNHSTLLQTVLSPTDYGKLAAEIAKQLEDNDISTGMKAIRLVGQHLNEWLAGESREKQQQFFEFAGTHPSDSVRCWAAFLKPIEAVALSSNREHIASLLQYIYRFAADLHFGVREIAWMAVREELAADITTSIELLAEWAKSPDANIRRFSLEAIRPRGVWAKHIESLKEEPQQALPILELLKNDISKYVQDSVGNWLNDASKSQPAWVNELCARWEEEAQGDKVVLRITKLARRTINKK